MPHNNNIIKAPVNIFDDIAYVLGVSSGDIGAIITNGIINKWALWKPVRSSKKSYLTKADRIQAGHGFDAIRPVAWSIVQGNQLPDSFTYLRPRGANTSPEEHFRVFDFLHIDSNLADIASMPGYNANAEPPIDWFLHIDGMDDAKELRFNTFYRGLSDVKIRAKYRVGNSCSMGTPGNMEIPLDEFTFYTGGGSVGNAGSQFKLCATNYAGGSLHSVEAPAVLNVLVNTGNGVGFEIPLASVMPGGSGNVWPQDSADNGYSFYPRIKDKDTSTYWSGVIGSPLRLIPYFFNPIGISYNGAICFYDGAPDSGGRLLASFQPDGNAVQVTPSGTTGSSVVWSSNNLYVRFYSIRVTNSDDSADVGLTIPGAGGVQLTIGGQTITSTGVTYNSQVPASYGSFTVPAGGSYTIAGMGRFIDFSFGAQSITLASGGGSATDKRASFAAPSLNIRSLASYAYESGQRLYYY